VLAATLPLAERLAPLAAPLPPPITQLNKVDAPTDKRDTAAVSQWTEVLTALTAGLLRHHAAQGQDVEQRPPAAPASVARPPVEGNLFPTLGQELAALLAADLGNTEQRRSVALPRERKVGLGRYHHQGLYLPFHRNESRGFQPAAFAIRVVQLGSEGQQPAVQW
jgi:hypothetical protein